MSNEPATRANLNAGLEALESRFEGKLNALEARLDRRLDVMEQRIINGVGVIVRESEIRLLEVEKRLNIPPTL